jgi:UDP-glucose 4-epimerase
VTRVVVTGASGNVGSAVVERLAGDPAVDSVVGVCRREHDWAVPKTSWYFADVGTDDLSEAFRGADVVIHLAWLFQPSRRADITWHANALGSQRVLDAAREARVPAVVAASSVGAYSPRRDTRPVEESWPTLGCAAAAYSREKAYLERLLDAFEASSPDTRVVRLRPAFTFQQGSAAQQRRLFLGPFVPHAALHRGRLPLLPLPRDLLLQAVHAEDVAEAYAAAALRPVSGAFNVTTEHPLDLTSMAEVLGSRHVPLPSGAVRRALSVGYAVRAVPAAPGLFDLAMNVPMMSPARAREELGWAPRHTGREALRAFLTGLEQNTGGPTPPLARSTSGRLRSHELATGVGGRP